MKIATYNIWNSEEGMPYRNRYIIEEIKKVNVDVMCLQEVCDKKMAKEIAIKAGYQYWYFVNYENDEEGLAILTNVQFEEKVSLLQGANAIYGSFLWNDKKVAVINVHLPWDSAVEREYQIVNIANHIKTKQYDYVFMAGDFNCSDTSDVQRFLKGDCLLNGKEANPCWFDLALSYAELKNRKVDSTLNFRDNPRFKNNTIEMNSRVDRILLRNTYPVEFPRLIDCFVFGQKVYEDIDLSASDHYGVAVEIRSVE